MAKHSGTLIVIEGGDASGKAVQTAALVKRLMSSGIQTQTMSFPRYNQVIGGMIGECLRGERGDFIGMDSRIVSTLFAADRFEAKPKIQAWLDAGTFVILDRYTTANMLHQGAKITDAAKRQETIKWIYNLEHQIFGLPIPDAVVYLDVPATVRAELQKKEQKKIDLAEENMEHQLSIDAYASDIFSSYENTFKISCMRDGQLRTIEDISEEIYTVLTPFISRG